ncbi:uncharacterized protein [Lolium perenne]|uniref:uncharacterized protein isoform X2 n=1 Tax=Lolium perenne TaxID=4522 RepID=UPI0021F6523C|nr:uncharacterized protein LOC127302327 isoform X2 [Lolium perenne]XP_051188717.1 uncharacterized protein LOC127302327 isoform X2 [Lolium perenne]
MCLVAGLAGAPMSLPASPLISTPTTSPSQGTIATFFGHRRRYGCKASQAPEGTHGSAQVGLPRCVQFNPSDSDLLWQKLGMAWLIDIHSSASLLNLLMKMKDSSARTLKICQVWPCGQSYPYYGVDQQLCQGSCMGRCHMSKVVHNKDEGVMLHFILLHGV